MNHDNTNSFLTALGGKVTESTKKWVTCTCVFAKWKHEGGVDKHPSSGMTVIEGEESHYNCFTCKSHGSPDSVYRQVKLLHSKNPAIFLDKKLILSLLTQEEEAHIHFSIPDYETEINKSGNKLKPFKKSWYNEFPKAYDHPYVKSRGLSKKLAKRLNVRLDPRFNRILFPVYDWEGNLMGVHGRAINGDTEPRYYAYPRNGKPGGNRNPDIWMGENHTDLDEPVILTEGQFDYPKVLQYYENVLAGLTTQMQESKLKRISTASRIITIFDHGVGGDAGRDLITKTFKQVPVQHLYVPKKYGDLGNTPDEVVYELLRYID